MRVVFGLLFVVIAIFSFSFAPVHINKILENKDADENVKMDFSTFTSAVCSNDGDFVKCKDELFVQCNGKVSKADDVQECSGFNLDKSKVTGFAVLEKEWKDPRVK